MKEIVRANEQVWMRGGTNFHPNYNKMMSHISYLFEGDDFPVFAGQGSEFHGEFITLVYGWGKNKETVRFRRPINRLGATCIAFLQTMMCIPKENKGDVEITFHVNPAGRTIVEAIHGEPIEEFYMYYTDKIREELAKFKKVSFVFHSYKEVDDVFGHKWEWINKGDVYGSGE
jgi:hypothetical protein